jgi:hypothetical protein
MEEIAQSWPSLIVKVTGTFTGYIITKKSGIKQA